MPTELDECQVKVRGDSNSAPGHLQLTVFDKHLSDRDDDSCLSLE